VTGSSRTRLPVAWKIALAIAGATPTMAISPIPSVGSAVQAACRRAREEALARGGANDLAEAIRSIGASVEALVDSTPGDESQRFSMHAFGAVFVEVAVDPATCVIDVQVPGPMSLAALVTSAVAPVAAPAERVPFMDRMQSVDEDHDAGNRNASRPKSLAEAADERGLAETVQAGVAHEIEDTDRARHIHLAPCGMERVSGNAASAAGPQPTRRLRRR
jgi:hypothetical protein